MTDPDQSGCVCVVCGYDNAGLGAGARCPECGAEAPWSRGAPMREADPRFRRCVAASLLLMAVAGALFAIEFVAMTVLTIDQIGSHTGAWRMPWFTTVDDYRRLMIGSMVLYAVYTLLFCSAVWLMSVREPAYPLPTRVRPVMRWGACALFVLVGIDVLWALAANSVPWLGVWLEDANEPAAAAVMAVVFVCWTVRAGSLVRRADRRFGARFDPALRRRALVIGLAYAGVIVVPYFAYTQPYFPEAIIGYPLMALLSVSVAAWSLRGWRRVRRA